MLETARNEANLSFVTYKTQKKSRLRRSKTNPTLNPKLDLSWLKLCFVTTHKRLATRGKSGGGYGLTGNKEIEVWGNKLRFMLLFSLCPARVCPRAPAEKDITVDYLPAAGGNFLRMYTSI